MDLVRKCKDTEKIAVILHGLSNSRIKLERFEQEGNCQEVFRLYAGLVEFKSYKIIVVELLGFWH